MNDIVITSSAVDKPRLVCLCGCLCSGKSTFAKNLIHVLPGAVLLKEDLMEHLIYQECHSDRARWMETQLEFYVRWAQLICTLQASPGTTVVVDHSLDVHHNIYSRVALEFDLISEREWQALCVAYESFRTFTDSRFATRNIALVVETETLASRLQMRNRDPGDSFHSAFLSMQVDLFRSWCTNQEGALLLGEYDLTSELTNDDMLQQRLRNFIAIGTEGDKSK